MADIYRDQAARLLSAAKAGTLTRAQVKAAAKGIPRGQLAAVRAKGSKPSTAQSRRALRNIASNKAVPGSYRVESGSGTSRGPFKAGKNMTSREIRRVLIIKHAANLAASGNAMKTATGTSGG